MQKIDDLNKKYSQSLLPNQVSNMLNNTQSWARQQPIAAAFQAVVETFFLIMAYSSVIFLTGGQPPIILNVIKFSFVFLLFNLAARFVSDSFSDKLGIAALSAIALKIVSLMSSKIVSW